MLKHGKLMVMLAMAALAVAGAVACNGGGDGGGESTDTPSDATSGGRSTNTPAAATGVRTPAGDGTPSPKITPSADQVTAIEDVLDRAQDAAAQGTPDRLKELLRPRVRDVIEEDDLVDAVGDDCLGDLTRTETAPTIDLRADGTASVEVEYSLDGDVVTVQWHLERQADGAWLLARLPHCP